MLFRSDDSSVDSELTFDFESFCKSLNESEERGGRTTMSFEDKVTMVSIGEKFSQGSVEVARGKRMTLMPSSNKTGQRKKTIMREVRKRQTRLAIERESIIGKSSVLGKKNRPFRDSGFFSFGSAHVIVRGTTAEF